MSGLDGTIQTVCMAAVLVWSIRVFVRVAREWWRSVQAPGEPRCANCGQIIFVEASNLCPECGEDLRISGLVTPDSLPRLKFLDCVVLFGLLVTPAAISLSETLTRHQSFGSYYQMTEYVNAADMMQKPGNDSDLFTVQAFGHCGYFKQQPDLIRVFVTEPNHGVYLGMNVTPVGWTAESWSPHSRGLYDMKALRATFWGAFPHMPADHVQALLTRLDATVRKMSRGEFPAVNTWDDRGRNRALYVVEPNVRLFSAILCVVFAWLATYLVVSFIWQALRRYRKKRLLMEQC